MENKEEKRNIDFTAAYNRAVSKYGEDAAREIFYGTKKLTNEKAISLIRNAVNDKYSQSGYGKVLNGWLDSAYELMKAEFPDEHSEAFRQLMGGHDFNRDLNDIIKSLFI